MGILDRHTHKDKFAYNTNHDLLMSLNPVHRAKLITYFIAANTCGKLDPKDRERFHLAKDTLNWHSFLVGAGFFTVSIIGLLGSGRRLTSSTIASFGVGYLARSIYNNHAEREFVFKSNLIQDLTIKYQFSLFDFHNSKKEVQIGQLAAAIMSEDHSMLNTVTD